VPSRVGAAALCAACVFAPSAIGSPLEPDGFAPPGRSVRVVFSTPLEGPVHSNFGYRWGRLHAGIDIAVLGTDRVRAPADGVVTFTGWRENYSGYGLIVQLRHEERLTTMYAHLARATVKSGDVVERGDLLGHAGCTGSCTGQHLHFEVRRGGTLVDPLREIAQRSS
jgi:murein DD-endopeptidase MepM/ murein hydrolase activator NlpD